MNVEATSFGGLELEVGVGPDQHNDDENELPQVN